MIKWVKSRCRLTTLFRCTQKIYRQLSQIRQYFPKFRYRWLILGFTFYFLIISLWQAPTINQGVVSPQQIRGVWMTNYGVAVSYYTTRLDEVVANIAKHRLNTIYPAVWNRGYTLHPSPVAESASGSARNSQTSLPFLPFQDALAGIVSQAHRQHLRIIPWFEYGLIVPKDSAIAQNHPDWLTKTRDGKISLEHNWAWLNPAHPQVQQFIVDLIVDVVKRYPVEGIQLDDHFAWPIDFGYDKYTVNLYRQEHKGSLPPKNTKNPEWMAWRARKLTQLMTKISRGVKAENPHAIVSLSPNSIQFAYNNYLQDWDKWVNLGLLDEVIVQVYRDELKAIQNELNNRELLSIRKHIPMAIGLYTGPFFNPKPLTHVKKEIEVVKQNNYQGVAFFCWETTLWFFKGGSNWLLEKTLAAFFN